MTSIFFSGSSGTGKSSTAIALGQALNMKVVDGISRNSPFEMHTLEHQKYMSRNVYATCTSIDNRILCRTPLDVWAYSKAFKINNQVMDEDNLVRFIKSDPTIIYFPPYWKPKNDGFRPTSVDFNAVVDNSISSIIEEFELKSYTVKNEPVKQRVQNIIKFLEDTQWQG